MRNDKKKDGGQRFSARLVKWAPRLEREGRVELVAYFEESAHWNPDFIVMMAIATTLAALGLIQDSTPVIIGAMLVAPLMAPLLGGGFALIQGNLRLFRESMKAMSYGIIAGLALSLLLGFLAPEYEPTMEIQSRGNVNILDLAVALASGMAAAYALVRPNVASTLSGVAIAAALVPPLAVVGIALAGLHLALLIPAAILLITNLVAIVLGAAIMFRVLGAHTVYAGKRNIPVMTRRITIALILFSAFLVIPLGNRLFQQVKIGQSRPLIYPASFEIREAVSKRVNLESKVKLMLMGRPSYAPEAGVYIYLASDGPLPSSLRRDLIDIVHKKLEKETPVYVLAVLMAGEEP
jgi:uncharacterized hydrophobic protein (TIGR00271 family)